MDFNQALNIAIGEINPQPWDYTDANGATLTVIPAGLRAEPGQAEVMVRITSSKILGAEIGITTAALPDLIEAIVDNEPWEHSTLLDGLIGVEPASDAGGDTILVVTGFFWDGGRQRETSVTMRLRASQRFPLASALARALDVARGWED